MKKQIVGFAATILSLSLSFSVIALGNNPRALPNNIRPNWIYKCITDNPMGKSNQDDPQLTVDNQTYTEFPESQYGDNFNGKDKDRIYLCFKTKRLRNSDSQTFQVVSDQSHNTTRFQKVIIFKDKNQVYINTYTSNMGANGISSYVLKTYPKLDASTFGCFYSDGIRMYCKDSKKIYLITVANESNGHTSRAISYKLHNTNLSPSLLHIDPNSNIITYNNQTFETINNQMNTTIPREQRQHDSFNINKLPHTIIFNQ